MRALPQNKSAGRPGKAKGKDARLQRKLSIPTDFYDRLVPAWKDRNGLPTPYRELAFFIPGVGIPVTRVSVPALPLSANAMWRKMPFGMVLHPDAKTYRKMIEMAIGTAKDQVLPLVSDSFGVIIFLESAGWLTAKGKTGRKDVDNRIKPVLDAMVEAVGEDCDHNCWDVHAFKLTGKEDRTTIYLYPRVMGQTPLLK